MQFQELNLSAPLLDAVSQMGFTEMTEIQEKTIPLLLEGKDVIGKSNTGTGKTAAFSLPILEQMQQEDTDHVCTLILCPTRELAMQACDEIRKFSRFQKTRATSGSIRWSKHGTTDLSAEKWCQLRGWNTRQSPRPLKATDAETGSAENDCPRRGGRNAEHGFP